MSFSVGDKVVIRIKGLERHHQMDEKGYGINDTMLGMEGKVCTIQQISYGYSYRFSDGEDMASIRLKECSWNWNQRCFELPKEDVVMF